MVRLIWIFFVLMMMPVSVSSQSFSDLWGQYDEAKKKDLPKTQMEVLQVIIKKAEKSGDYGHLLKARLKNIESVTAVTPDSLNSEVQRIVEQEKLAGKSNPVLAVVYQAVLGAVYRENPSLDEHSGDISQAYFRKALSNPSLLASTKTDAFVPLLTKGDDSRYFNHDLLSPVATLVDDLKTLHEYYSSTGNREAACLSACLLLRKTSPAALTSDQRRARLHKIDSLIQRYGDLDVAGELALLKGNLISILRDMPVADKIRFADEAMERWSNWPRTKSLMDVRNSWVNPQFSVDLGCEMLLPGKERTIILKGLRHITSLTMKISKVDVDGSREYNLSNAKDWQRIQDAIIQGSEIVQSRQYSGHPEYEIFQDSITIGPLQKGIYLMEFSCNDGSVKPVYHLLYVSDVFVLSQSLPGNKTQYVVVSSTTGKPLKKAQIILSSNRDERKLVCGKNGEAIDTYSSAQYGTTRVFAYTADDKYCPNQSFWTRGYAYNPVEDRRVFHSIFTDRSIYRPGQTVHAVVLIFDNEKGLNTHALEGVTTKVSLYDANHKTVASKEVKTNEFGKADVSFELPSSGLTGHFSLSTDKGSVSFQVEEYKRPTFEVEFEKYEEAYKNGDTITVKGKARTYSGVPVQSAKVAYTVSRKANSWWWYSGNDVVDLLTDTTTTDEKGCFAIKMPMLLPETEVSENGYRRPLFYRIVANAVVTDQAGESHEGEFSLPVSNRDKAFSFRMPGIIERKQMAPVTFSLRNMAGNLIDGEVSYTIDDHEEVFKAKANLPVDLSGSPLLKESGKHIIRAMCEGDTVKAEFILFSLDDKKPCVQTHDWFYTSANRFPNDGSPVYVQVGSSDQETIVFYNVFSGEKILEKGSFVLNNANQTRKWTYKEQYGSGVLLTFAWVKEGIAYTHQEEISRPLPDKRILLKWETFRDRLTPGTEEEWILSATYPDGKPAEAQMIATIYDHSLDQISSHNWWFSSRIGVTMPYTMWNSTSFSNGYLHASKPYRTQNVPSLRFTHFDTDLFTYWDQRRFLYGTMTRYKNSAMLKEVPLRAANASVAEMSKALVADEEAMDDSEKKVFDVVETVEEKGGAASEEQVSPQLRENLNETAAFIPYANVDQDGRITLKFKLPESVTTWRVMGLATDKAVNYGQISAEAVAQKEVMIVPNVPRFVRLGDRAQVTANIFNTTDHAVSGKASIVLSDPENETVVFTQALDFKVDAEQTTSVAFEYLPEGMPRLLVCKVIAQGEGFSDGEQHYLPVLSNMELVTRTLPFTQNGAQVSSFDLSKLFPKGISDGKLTIEYTNNPAWLMIQALPTMAAEKDQNAISQATAYYANALGRHIMSLSPAIKTMVQKWSEQMGDGTLVSNLSKNEELKDLLLNETPWVSEADHEEGQKRSLVKFFDENVVSQRMQTALDLLRDLQLADGSWSWWKGMEGSPYMTVAVSEMLIRLNTMIGRQNATQSMLRRACDFMGKKLIEEMESIKKMEKEGLKCMPSELALHTLYNLALHGEQLPGDVQKAADYLIGLFEQKTSEFTIFGKARGAVILAQYGRTKRAEDFMKSLDEYTVSTEEMGRYFDTRKAYYSWCSYLIPTEVAAIEAYKMLQPGNTQAVDEMRRWLLQQKRAQMWNTPVNSVNAVYAFLEGNMKSLDNGVESRITLDGELLPMPQATAGVGYVKQAVEYGKQQKVEVEKTSDGTSWGALYAQFMQKSVEVEKSNAGLSVTRELRSDAESLKVGDKVVVRITIKAERDMDFVEVIDRRAACMEPVSQVSGYQRGCYIAPKDYTTTYYFNKMAKGTHVVETEYYVDRAGSYEMGTCKAQCAYAPEFSSTCGGVRIDVQKQ